MKIFGMILTILGAFGFIFYVLMWFVEDYYVSVGPIRPVFLWVGLTILGLFLMSKPKEKPFPYN